MVSRLNPYLSFPDTARQAMEFYRDVFGGELELATFGEYGASDSPDRDKIMHGVLTTDGGFTLMAADVPTGQEHRPGNTVSIALNGDDAEELRGYWHKLTERGQVIVALERQMWGDEFGMCVDRFGIEWLVDIGTREG